MAKFGAATKKDAEAELGTRLDALDAILDGADVYDVMQVCAYVLARVAPDQHRAEFEAEFLRVVHEHQQMAVGQGPTVQH
jgi:hypothetical protein